MGYGDPNTWLPEPCKRRSCSRIENGLKNFQLKKLLKKVEETKVEETIDETIEENASNGITVHKVSTPYVF
jgi:chromosome segregation and condensation protein ScpB